MRYRIGEPLGPSQPDTAEIFFLEQYLLFVERNGKTYGVHHTPYPAQRAEVLEVKDGLLHAAGLDSCHGPPAFAHYSSGVDVEVFYLKPV